jgi:hypothetical protein
MFPYDGSPSCKFRLSSPGLWHHLGEYQRFGGTCCLHFQVRGHCSEGDVVLYRQVAVWLVSRDDDDVH